MNNAQRKHATRRCEQNKISPESLSGYHPFVEGLAVECGAYGKPVTARDVQRHLKNIRKTQGFKVPFPRSRQLRMPDDVRQAILEHFGQDIGFADSLSEDPEFMQGLFDKFPSLPKDSIARWSITVRKKIGTMRPRTVCYLMWSERSQQFKIGMSVDIDNRLRAFRTGCPDIEIVGRGTKRMSDSVLHRQFKAYRVQGEWFSKDLPVDDVLEAGGMNYVVKVVP